jgi:DNA-binding MarR family transcriptional regulator
MARDDDDTDAPPAAIAAALERLLRLTRAREHEGGLHPAQREALRYLARANRFSNSPGALALYLGATKGTVSQTLIALERKGLVTKAKRDGATRSVSLVLTDSGRQALETDPWQKLGQAVGDLGGKTRRRMARGLDALLRAELARGAHKSFGLCPDCRFFRSRSGRSPDAPDYCMLFDDSLGPQDVGRICVAHQPR